MIDVTNLDKDLENKVKLNKLIAEKGEKSKEFNKKIVEIEEKFNKKREDINNEESLEIKPIETARELMFENYNSKDNYYLDESSNNLDYIFKMINLMREVKKRNSEEGFKEDVKYEMETYLTDVVDNKYLRIVAMIIENKWAYIKYELRFKIIEKKDFRTSYNEFGGLIDGLRDLSRYNKRMRDKDKLIKYYLKNKEKITGRVISGVENFIKDYELSEKLFNENKDLKISYLRERFSKYNSDNIEDIRSYTLSDDNFIEIVSELKELTGEEKFEQINRRIILHKLEGENENE